MTGKQNQTETDKYRVFLYKLLHNAPAPMTFDQIVKGMMAAPGNFSRACVDYQAHVGVEGGKLDERGEAEAQRWWVFDLLTVPNGSHLAANKLFITSKPSRVTPLNSSEVRWSASPKYKPKVWEDRITTELVDWTPEYGAAGVQASAGMRFLADLGAYRAKHPRMGQDLADILEVAEQAIRNNPRG